MERQHLARISAGETQQTARVESSGFADSSTDNLRPQMESGSCNTIARGNQRQPECNSSAGSVSDSDQRAAPASCLGSTTAVGCDAPRDVEAASHGESDRTACLQKSMATCRAATAGSGARSGARLLAGQSGFAGIDGAECDNLFLPNQAGKHVSQPPDSVKSTYGAAGGGSTLAAASAGQAPEKPLSLKTTCAASDSSDSSASCASGSIPAGSKTPSHSASQPAASGAGTSMYPDDLHAPPSQRPMASRATRSEDSSSGSTAPGHTDPPVTTHGPGEEEGAAYSEGSSRQTAFEEAKREIALYPFQQQIRKDKLQETGAEFGADVMSALSGFPAVAMQFASSGNPVGFTDADKRAIEECTGNRFIEAGGIAGGVKAIHEPLGLFLKFPFDNEKHQIYGSYRMAAKAAKREAAASRWVHAMDSVHVSTPLLQCVDLPIRLTGGQSIIIRVQVFALVRIRGYCRSDPTSWSSTTLRVGSSDGGRSAHWDEEQLEDVVKPLAKHFFVGQYIGRAHVIEHLYRDSAAHTAAIACRGSSGEVEGDTPTPVEPPSIVDSMRVAGMDPAALRKVEKVLDPGHLVEQSGPSAASASNEELSNKEFDLDRAVADSIRASGAVLDYRAVLALPRKTHAVVDSEDAQFTFHLPFDVELHQLDNGQRMVLDTHRLLIPDVVWIDWMKSTDAAPRVWMVINGSVETGQLPVFDGCYFLPESDRLDSLAAALNGWCDDHGCRSVGGLHGSSAASSARIRFDSSDLQVCPDAGCVVARCNASGGATTGAVAVVSCPQWLYCGGVTLACLLPPEASDHLRRLSTNAESGGLNPDMIMMASDGGKARRQASALIKRLYAAARGRCVEAYRDEIAIEMCMDEGFDPAVHLARHRDTIKRAMHSVGLGLRHSRLLVDALDPATSVKAQVQKALVFGIRSTSLAYNSIQLAGHRLAGKSNPTPPCVLFAAYCYASKGVHNLCESVLAEGMAAFAASQGHQSAGLDDGPTVCVGTDIAASGGVHRLSSREATAPLFRELAHMQRIGSQGAASIIRSIDSFAVRSSGLRTLRIATATLCAQERMSRSTGTMIEFTPETPVQDREKAFDPYVAALTKLATCLFTLGNMDEAADTFVEALRVATTAHGKGSIQHAAAQNRLGGALSSLARYDPAMDLMRSSLAILTQHLGEWDTECSKVLNNMATCLMEQGLYDEAIQHYRKSLQINERAYGKGTTEYVSAVSNLAASLQQAEHYIEAKELFSECLELRKSLYGTQHDEYATSLRNMAICMRSMGEARQALRLQQQSLHIAELVLGKMHPQYGVALSNTGAFLVESHGDLNAAMQYYQRAMQTYSRSVGTSHPLYASCLNNIGSCLREQGKYEEAMASYQKCQIIRKARIGKQHPDYVDGELNIGRCYLLMLKLDAAAETFRECRQSMQGKGRNRSCSLRYARSCYHLGECRQRQSNHSEACSLLQECLDIEGRWLGPLHTEYKGTLITLIQSLKALGNHDEALRLLDGCLTAAIDGAQRLLRDEWSAARRDSGNGAGASDGKCGAESPSAEGSAARYSVSGSSGRVQVDHGLLIDLLQRKADYLNGIDRLDHGMADQAMVAVQLYDAKHQECQGQAEAEASVQMLYQVCECCVKTGNPGLAADLHERCYRVLKANGCTHLPWYVDNLGKVVNLCQQVGKYDRAIDAMRELLEYTAIKHGTYHPVYFSRRRDLIQVLQGQGRHDEAEQYM